MHMTCCSYGWRENRQEHAREGHDTQSVIAMDISVRDSPVLSRMERQPLKTEFTLLRGDVAFLFLFHWVTEARFTLTVVAARRRSRQLLLHARDRLPVQQFLQDRPRYGYLAQSKSQVAYRLPRAVLHVVMHFAAKCWTRPWLSGVVSAAERQA